MREKPCPFRIVDDLGGGFSMGCLMGAAWHFCRGMYFSPKSEKFFGGIMMMKKRAPILAGKSTDILRQLRNVGWDILDLRVHSHVLQKHR